jgi:TldD protein
VYELTGNVWPIDLLRKAADKGRKQAGVEFAEIFAELTEKCEVIVGGGGIRVRCETIAGAAIQAAGLPLVHAENPTEPRLSALADAVAWAAGRPGGLPAMSGRESLRDDGDRCLPAGRAWAADEIAAAVGAGKAAAGAAMAVGQTLARVTVRIRLRRRSWCVLNTNGPSAAGARSSAVLTVKCVGVSGHAGQASATALTSRHPSPSGWDPAAAGSAAAGQVEHRRESRPVAPGEMPVVFGAGAGGALLHEICGHVLEADCLDDGSVLAAARGARVAPEGIWIIDSGRLPGGWGSCQADDEGASGTETALVADGVLVGALSTRSTAARWTDGTSTGNARRESFRHPVLPRMTNTYLAPGELTEGEIISGTRSGLYVRALGGARVRPGSGEFAIDVDSGFVIRNGRLAEPVSDAVLVGDCLTALSGIDRVGDELLHHPATCRKAGQYVPVSYGQPAIRVTGLAVSARR